MFIRKRIFRCFRILSGLVLIAFLLVSSGSMGMSGNDALVHPLARSAKPPISLMPSGGLTPDTMRLTYGLTSLIQKGFTGKGQTIIDLVSFGSPTLQQDMNVFDQTFNLPTANLQVISPLNIPKQGSSSDQKGWAGETELDVEIMHALAPDAKIIVLESPVSETQGIVGLPEFRQLQQYIIQHKLGNIVSLSWGASELTLLDATAQQEVQQWNAILQQGTISNHITYFASSGDSGATDAVDLSDRLATIPTTSFAADSPWITGVGGTTLRRSGTNSTEMAWNGSGGGMSRFYALPSYQKLLPATMQTLLNNRRGVPDVSADANPATGLAVFLTGHWTRGGGTSASAPVWAAIQAIANQAAGHPLGFINPALYKLAASSTYHQDFHDITAGNNSNRQAGVTGFSAASGWDPVTGLGTPNAEKLIPDLIAALR